ncbi:2',5' RNA ligase family [bacterium BMS3Abin06]|nr:2',5' RNA ligase family [bacterium BMS3Abin06]
MRSFIAIELSETAKSALAELQQELKKCGADIRWVKPENIHLTLKFLGNIENEIVDDVLKIIESRCKKFRAFDLEIKGTGTFPNLRSPSVLWVGVNSNADIAALQNEIEAGMTSLGFERENRKYTPHLTLGRFRSSQGKGPLLEKIELFKNRKYGLINVGAVALMRSDLSPSGARHSVIAEIFLGKNKI